MNLEDVLERWDEIDGVDSWTLIALRPAPNAKPDDRFPYVEAPIVDISIDDDAGDIDFLMDVSSDTNIEDAPLTVGEVREALREVADSCGDYGLYLRESVPEDDEGYELMFDAPVIGVAANHQLQVFGLVQWSEE